MPTNPSSICASLVGAIGTRPVATGRAGVSFAIAALAKPEEAVAEDPVVGTYLTATPNICRVTVNVANGEALVHRVSFAEPARRSVGVLHKVAMNPTGLDPFKRPI